MNWFVTALFADPFYYFSWVIVIVFSICIHEYSHAHMAARMGDPTAMREGHLSLNPLVQMGWVSLVMLLLIGIAWGAVPVDPRRLRTRSAAAAVAFAGPAANLLLSGIFALLMVLSIRVLGEGSEPAALTQFFYYGAGANGVLFVLNMLPVPMFDGWPIFALAIPGMNRISAQTMQTVSWVILVAVFATPLGATIWSWGMSLALFLIRGWGLAFAWAGQGFG